MEHRDIEIFLALAEELHFGRTAERLHVSTARVSQTIKKLEGRVGVPLFERTSRRVALTPIGRRLRDDLDPAYDQIRQGVDRAITAGRDVRGVLRVGFFRAAASRFILEAAESFQARYPDCEVQIRENQLSDGLERLRADEIDMLFLMLPVREPDLATGPVLVREARLLAVSARHPFARRSSVSLDDLARDKVLRPPSAIPAYLDESLVPQQASDGRPIERGPAFATIQEMFALVGAGKGMYPVPAHTVRYYARPDVAYLPILDAPPFEWAFTWLTSGATTRVRAFNRAARDLAEATGRSDPRSGFLDAPT